MDFNFVIDCFMVYSRLPIEPILSCYHLDWPYCTLGCELRSMLIYDISFWYEPYIHFSTCISTSPLGLLSIPIYVLKVSLGFKRIRVTILIFMPQVKRSGRERSKCLQHLISRIFTRIQDPE